MAAKKSALRVILYARLSVAKEESVSIERQFKAGRKFAADNGWIVVDEIADEGVSASKTKPEQRKGWRQVVGHPEPYDAVVVWRMDRLARRTLDFLLASEALSARGAYLLTVDGQLNVESGLGKAMAVLGAMLGEMEADAMSARGRDARRQLLSVGRRAGGRPPFGWMNVDNPAGAGKVLAKDPERIGYVVAMVAKALSGASIYSIRQWLVEEAVEPRPRKVGTARWYDASIEAILRNPTLAGMTAYSPGRKPGEDPDPWAVVRDAAGLAVVDPNVAIITTDERRRLLAVLDSAKRPGSRERAGAEPALLHGLVKCGLCGGTMHRGTAAGKYRQYRCSEPNCARPTVLRDPVEAAVEDEFLRVRGDALVVHLTERPMASPSRLGDIEEALAKAASEMTADGVDELEVLAKVKQLKEMRETARAESEGAASREWSYDSRTNRQAWVEATSVEERNVLLRGALSRVLIQPSVRRGQRFDRSRIVYDWIDLPAPAGIEVRALRGRPFRSPKR